MEQAFRNWLIKRGNAAAANIYPKAIHAISDHYSTETGTKTNIYSIQGQLTGFLTLPLAVLNTLNLRAYSREEGTLGDGSSCVFIVPEVVFP